MADLDDFTRRIVVDKLEIAITMVESAIIKNMSGANGEDLKWVDTGFEMNTVTHDVNADLLEARTGPNTNYAIWGEFGTGIYAENGDGRQDGWVYKDENGFHHTMGTRPRPAIRRGLYDNLDNIRKIFAI